jgi:hypothetical protein
MPLFKVAALLLAANASSRMVGAQPSCPDTLDRHEEIDSKATLYYAVVPSNPAGSGNGLLCGRLEAENDGWIGIGFSTNGMMRGSNAVIGIPAEGTILKYDLASGAVTLVDDDRQTLNGTSIANEDGMVTMEFAKLLVEDGEIEIKEYGNNNFIHARGGFELGYHTRHKNFIIEFSPSTNLTAPADAPVDAPAAVNDSSVSTIVRPFHMPLILSLGAHVLSNYLIRFL